MTIPRADEVRSLRHDPLRRAIRQVAYTARWFLFTHSPRFSDAMARTWAESPPLGTSFRRYTEQSAQGAKTPIFSIDQAREREHETARRRTWSQAQTRARATSDTSAARRAMTDATSGAGAEARLQLEFFAAMMAAKGEPEPEKDALNGQRVGVADNHVFADERVGKVTPGVY